MANTFHFASSFSLFMTHQKVTEKTEISQLPEDEDEDEEEKDGFHKR